MKATQRPRLGATWLTTAALLAMPLALTAQSQKYRNGEPYQRGMPCGNDAPKLLIGAFNSTDRQLGVDAGDELRSRERDDHTAKDLCVKPKIDINTTLEQSGFTPDSALSANDLAELAKTLNANLVVAGQVTKLGKDSVREEVKMFVRSGQNSIAQPLAQVTAKNVGDAAGQLEKSLENAMKQLPGFTTCHNEYLAQKYPEAEKGALAGVQAYPQSTVARFCALQAMGQLKSPPDSVIALSNAILAIDPTSTGALAYLADAYKQKGDKDKAIETDLKLYHADPSNSALAQTIVAELGASGAPEKALPIIDELLKDQPGDPTMLKMKWLLLLASKNYKGAYTAGDEYVAADTSAANEDYFGRMAAAAAADSNTAKQTEYLARAAKKYPKNAEFQVNYAKALFLAGQLQQALTPAEAAVADDPKNAGGYQLLLLIEAQLGQPDSAFATAKKALAAGVPKPTISEALLPLVSPSLKKAQDSHERADWQTVLNRASQVDSIVSSPQTHFFIGYAAFSIGVDALQNLPKGAVTKAADRQKACDEGKIADDMFTTAQINLPAGGSAQPDAVAAILKNLQQYADVPAQVKKTFSCKW